jgi:bifunctional non-homologous end joining protein LigD
MRQFSQVLAIEVEPIEHDHHEFVLQHGEIRSAIGGGNGGLAVDDGAAGADGTTDFSLLQNELRGKSARLVMIAFDLLYLNGRDLRKLPLIERKGHLKKLIERTAIQFSEVLKSREKRYSPTPARWTLKGWSLRSATAAIFPDACAIGVKKACAPRETLTIAGFAPDNDWD